MSLSLILEKIIFRPVLLNKNYKYSFEKPFEEDFLYPEKGVSLNYLKFKAEKSRGAILYFHGNKDNLVRWGKIASEFTRFNFDVFVIDYRGYGKSTGERTENKLFDDALFFYNFVKQTYNPNEIVIFGRSLGTGIASWLASKTNPDKLILETPFYNLNNLIGNFLPEFFYKNKIKYQFNSNIYLKNTNFPILIFHGTKDEVVPYESGEKLFNKINNPNKILVTLEGGKHNNLSSFELYQKKISDFLNIPKFGF
ncbi:MAG: alpha/beta fold hydrolase [Bacteroidetes bacterium]|nr:alpha/beta fold hydrolase [Bacteroidota bacterium]